MGIFINIAAVAAAWVSYLSPNNKTMSGCNLSKLSERSEVAIPVDLTIEDLASVKKRFSILSSILKPSFSICLKVRPYSVE